MKPVQLTTIHSFLLLTVTERNDEPDFARSLSRDRCLRRVAQVRCGRHAGDLDAARDLAMRNRYQFQWWATSLVNAQPYQGKKKGKDGGVDGIKYFHDADTEGARTIIVSVKSGHLKADDVRSLMAVRKREGAEFGLLICLYPPTKPMLADAASDGFYTGANGKDYPRIQLLDIASLLSGKQRAEHPDQVPDLNFKKAKKEAEKKGQEKLF
jgi:hypothetical protein